MSEELTIRDQFAIAALSALDGMMSPDEAAEAAYEYADAMMEARKKDPPLSVIP